MLLSLSSLTISLHLFLSLLAAALTFAPAAKSASIPAIDISPDMLAPQTLSLVNPTASPSLNLTFIKPQIICRTSNLSTRRPLSVAGCAEILFTILSTSDIVPFQPFSPTAPWRLPAEYVDSKDTCEMRLKASESRSADQFPLSHVLQTAARIASHCQRHMEVNLGGQALVGPKQMFSLEVYGPGVRGNTD